MRRGGHEGDDASRQSTGRAMSIRWDSPLLRGSRGAQPASRRGRYRHVTHSSVALGCLRLFVAFPLYKVVMRLPVYAPHQRRTANGARHSVRGL